ncbi:tyrosine-type recombinase/integrase [Bacillus piscicola]|uniref:tyrosine-type recombinase/integrase n=1 Tax=Bacillus piscicola TaxID=1632684 RepID=UPI001F095F15|nr:tyrosine-type recombinase/integrase [Bacillus piscicola]
MALKGKSTFKRVSQSSKHVRSKSTRYQFSPNRVTRYSLHELYDRYMSVKKAQGLSPTTIRDYDIHFGWFIDFLEEVAGIKDLENEEIVPEVFTEYIRFMSDKGLKATTINVRVRTLRAFIRWCYEEQYINEIIHDKFKPVKQPYSQVDALSVDELHRIFACVDETRYSGFRDMTLMLVMLDTMARIKELLSMRRENLDLRNGSIRLEADHTKTKKERILPLSARSLRYLSFYLEETEEFYNDTLFLTYDGRPLAAGTVRKSLADYAEQAGITNKRVSPHTFRHTGALLYIMNGGDPFSLQHILGHSDLSMVRRYVNLANSDVTKQHNQFSPLKTIFDRRS